MRCVQYPWHECCIRDVSHFSIYNLTFLTKRESYASKRIEKFRLPVDVRGSKTSLLKLSISTEVHAPTSLKLRPKYAGGIWERSFHSRFLLWKRIICFPSTQCRTNLKSQHLLVILDLRLKKTLSEKSHDYRDAIVFEKFRFQNVFGQHENENWVGVFKLLRFEERFRNWKLGFLDRLVWMAVLTVATIPPRRSMDQPSDCQRYAL